MRVAKNKRTDDICGDDDDDVDDDNDEEGLLYWQVRGMGLGMGVG